MKKLIVLLVLFTIGLLGAEEVKKPTTKFEQVLLKKGTLIVKEFNEFGTFEKIKGEIAVLTDVNNDHKTFAFRITKSYWHSQYDTGEATAVFDADEVESAIKSLDFMIKKSASMPNTAPYTEIVYRGNGEPSFGFYISDGKKRIL